MPEVGPVKIKNFLLGGICSAFGGGFLALGVNTAVIAARILRRANVIHMGIFLIGLIILVSCSLGVLLLRYGWSILIKNGK